MITREQVLAVPCPCGAHANGRCYPTSVLVGFHGARIIAAGGRLKTDADYKRERDERRARRGHR